MDGLAPSSGAPILKPFFKAAMRQGCYGCKSIDLLKLDCQTTLSCLVPVRLLKLTPM